MSITTIQSIPLDIRKDLSAPHIPWRINKRIFDEMKSQTTGNYRKVQVLPTDPEWRFVCRYFHQDKPNHFGIKKVYCIDEKHQQQAFEFNLSYIEKETTNFKPTWYNDPRASQRAKAIERWKQSANVFSPFFTMGAYGRRRTWKEVKILPLWHGSNSRECEAIATSGFVHFGEISPEDAVAENTNKGFFCNGIYFTNSARYAADIYSQGHLILAWVSMKEPFPIVGDPDQVDMKAIQEEDYKDYNALYIPITSINPSDPYETTYYPTKENEITHCDEFVVFHKSQALPRFWIELEIELPYAPSNSPQFVNELIPHITKLLQNPNVDNDQRLRNFLCKELGSLLALEGDAYLEERHETMYEQLRQVLDSQGKVNIQVSRILTGTPQATTLIPSLPQPTQSIPPSNNLVTPQSFSKPEVPPEPIQPQVSPSIHPIAFGKDEWIKYFGDIGVEPPLPANIENILNAPCAFWPDKKVKETHLLVLIPNTVNGKPFTLNYLEKLIQSPKSGHVTKYKYYNSYADEALGSKSYPSHWSLMTTDIIPGTRNQFYRNCRELIASHKKRTGIPYELPRELDATTSILMHYVRTGERLFSDNPLTYTYSQDVDKDGDALTVGGFAPVGICIDYNVVRGAAAYRKF